MTTSKTAPFKMLLLLFFFFKCIEAPENKLLSAKFRNKCPFTKFREAIFPSINKMEIRIA